VLGKIWEWPPHNILKNERRQQKKSIDLIFFCLLFIQNDLCTFQKIARQQSTKLNYSKAILTFDLTHHSRNKMGATEEKRRLAFE
jgi:hypothetical protein